MVICQACVLLIFNTIHTSSPLSLKECSLNAIANNIQNKDIYEISKRMYPHIFDEDTSLQNSGFTNIFFYEIPCNKEINLSGMNLERIPIALAKKMRKVQKLNLSYGQRWNLNEEWFKQFSTNLKELSLSNCMIKNCDFESINNLTKLESLIISGNANLNFNSPHFISLLKRLKHLDVSYCYLNDDSINILFEHATELESLNLNGHGKIVFSEQIQKDRFKNLKVLKLVECNLKAKDLERILVPYNLEEIDFSSNDFSEISENVIQKLFAFKNNDEDNDKFETPERKNFLLNGQNRKRNCLRVIGLNNCQIGSKKFVKKLFEIPSLETLDLSGNYLNFDFSDIVQDSSKSNLKSLKLNFSKISGFKNLYSLTNFPLLEKLNISYNNFSEIPNNFTLGCSRNSLKEINIKLAKLNQNGLKAITNCPKLERLIVCWNRFGNIPERFTFGCSKDTLTNLNIELCTLNYNGLKAITDCSKLQTLGATWNQFDNVPEGFTFGCSKDSLKEIHLGECSLNLEALKAISDCSKLERLYVNGNSFRNMPEHFTFGRARHSLKEIDLYKCNLNIHGLKLITDCPKLEKLKISCNSLSEISNDFTFGSSKNSLKHLFVFGDILNCHSLKAIANCTKLKSLNIIKNSSDLSPINIQMTTLRILLKEMGFE